MLGSTKLASLCYRTHRSWLCLILLKRTPGNYECTLLCAQAIGCTGEDRIELSFFCTRLGLTVEENEKGNVIVAGWEEDSAAAEHSSLMVREAGFPYNAAAPKTDIATV